jgi:uncharacterized protein (DUF736 family)
MPTIGTLEEVQNNGEKEYWGQIRTLHTSLSIKLIAYKDFGNSNPNSPDYLVYAKVPGGQEAQIGSAWLQVPKNTNSRVKEYLSISIDDISFPDTLSIQAFPTGDGKWNVTWSRDRKKEAA